MDIIQTVSLLILLSMVVYFILVNIFKVNTVNTPGTIGLNLNTSNTLNTLNTLNTSNPHLNLNTTTKENMQNLTVPLNKSEPAHVDHITNQLPQHIQFQKPMKYPTPAKIELDASDTNASAIWNPEATGIYAQNQDMFDKPVNFGSDVTNIKQFYTNNPEVFGKIIGKSEVTNVADWDRQSKEMFTAAQTSSAGPIQAANFEDNFSTL